MRNMKIQITDVTIQDVRFPKVHEKNNHHYSIAYVTLQTNHPTLQGYSATFITNDYALYVAAINLLKQQLIGKKLSAITEHIGEFWQHLTRDSQSRWPNSNKSILYQTTTAIMNAVWDLWARREQKPLWRLIVDMTPEELVRCLDLHDVRDVLTVEEVLTILQKNALSRAKRIKDLLHTGYPVAAANDYHVNGCRLSGVNHMLTLLLLAAKLNVPIRLDSSGSGFGEYVQHLAMVDYIYISGTLKNRVLEYPEYLSEHFKAPAMIRNGHYQVPLAPGYSVEIKKNSLMQYGYPHGQAWQAQ
ncbi:MAG: mitochondrial enolase superfamily member 1-like protein [uncultured bacterium]|nr:MAG: mitochondrial enolase superfamily member 1-like protein [uncultured bacterium]